VTIGFTKIFDIALRISTLTSITASMGLILDTRCSMVLSGGGAYICHIHADIIPSRMHPSNCMYNIRHRLVANNVNGLSQALLCNNAFFNNRG
jgi:hypothetical protein